MEIRRDRYLERLIAHKGNGRVKIVTGICEGIQLTWGWWRLMSVRRMASMCVSR
jgi:hypothetical protein